MAPRSVSEKVPLAEISIKVSGRYDSSDIVLGPGAEGCREHQSQKLALLLLEHPASKVTWRESVAVELEIFS